MRFLLALLVAASFVGCAAGVPPSAVSYDATYRATAPVQSYGVTRETKRALVLPATILNCLTTGAAKVVGVVGETGVCVFENITPEVIVPIVSAPNATVSGAACAPAPASACTSGACAPPPAKAAAPCR